MSNEIPKCQKQSEYIIIFSFKKVLRPIEDRGTLETAHRVRETLSQIMRYGVACGLCERDPTVDLRGDLKPIRRKHPPALDTDGIPDPTKLGALLRAVDGIDGSPTVNTALRRLGYDGTEFVSHGWRAIFRNLPDEVLQERIDIIEAQLSHQVSDALGRAYNRTSFLKERRDLMNCWGSFLDGLNKANKEIPLVKRTGSD